MNVRFMILCVIPFLFSIGCKSNQVATSDTNSLLGEGKQPTDGKALDTPTTCNGKGKRGLLDANVELKFGTIPDYPETKWPTSSRPLLIIYLSQGGKTQVVRTMLDGSKAKFHESEKGLLHNYYILPVVQKEGILGECRLESDGPMHDLVGKVNCTFSENNKIVKVETTCTAPLF